MKSRKVHILFLVSAVTLLYLSKPQALGQVTAFSHPAGGGDAVLSIYAPDSLRASIDNDGHIALSWATPQGLLPVCYRVWRTTDIRFDSIAVIKNPFVVSYTDFSAEPGNYYYYAVEALYSIPVKGNIAYTEIDFIPRPNDIAFTGRALTTAVVNKTYDYPFEISAPVRERLRYTLSETAPDSMVINAVDRRIYWIPRQKGVYPVTIFAEDTLTRARAAHEFVIHVADAPARVYGSVRDELGLPVENALIRVSQIGNGTAYTYEALAGPDGHFAIDNVQGGLLNGGPATLSKVYVYVQSPSPDLASQWFINANRVNEADERLLFSDDSLRFDFILHPNPNNRTSVTGVIRDTAGVPVSFARVSFIPTSWFIHIGDTTNRSNPFIFSLDLANRVFAETTATTDASGNYAVSLPVGKTYYVATEKEGFLNAYYPSERNVLEARAVRVTEQSGPLDINVVPTLTGNSSLSGKIVKSENGVPPVSTVIVLVPTTVRRGGGGTLEFITAHTDSNGVFIVKSLKDSTWFSVLAVPFGGSAPLFYNPSGSGSTDWSTADSVLVSGDVQDIDIKLPSITHHGIGSIWGTVTTRNQTNQYIPLPGTLVYAITANTNTIAGYAISDSLGFYSIGGLPPGVYTVAASKIGWKNGKEINNQYLLYTDSRSYERVLRVDVFIPPDPPTNVSVDVSRAPGGFELYQNYPNPFNPVTVIRYHLPKAANISLKLFSPLGREIGTLEEGPKSPGTHAIEFTGDNLPSGIYFYRLQVEGVSMTRRLVLMK